jgi:peptide/nickel transport system substrate-binding protein
LNPSSCTPAAPPEPETIVITEEVEVEVQVEVTPTPNPDGIKRGGTLLAAISADPQGFDPHITSAHSSFEILENVYDTLVTVDDDLNMVPSLAESWEVSEDNLTWIFHLREGVTFHNGRALTADDVVYSYERIMDEETGSGVSWRFGSVESVEAVDDLTVAINLTEASPNLLGRIGAYKGIGTKANPTLTA